MRELIRIILEHETVLGPALKALRGPERAAEVADYIGHVASVPDDILDRLRGPQGEAGPQGPVGPTGPQGIVPVNQDIAHTMDAGVSAEFMRP